MELPHTTTRLNTSEITKASNDVVLSYGAVLIYALSPNRTAPYRFAITTTAPDRTVGSQEKRIHTLPLHRNINNAPHRRVEL